MNTLTEKQEQDKRYIVLQFERRLTEYMLYNATISFSVFIELYNGGIRDKKYKEEGRL